MTCLWWRGAVGAVGADRSREAARVVTAQPEGEGLGVVGGIGHHPLALGPTHHVRLVREWRGKHLL